MKNKIPPLIILLTACAVMWFVARSNFAYPVAVPYPLLLALGMAAIGACIATLAIRQFGAVETTVNPHVPESATSLVSSGIFRLSRNPMYLSLTFILTAWGLWLGSVTNIAVIVLFVIVITELQIKPEENALRSLFGEAYDSYCNQVRRWL